MSNSLQAKAVTTTTQFGNAPYETSSASQGTIVLYKDADCSWPLAEATPLVLGECFRVPESGIKAVSIESLPSCPNYATPLLVVSDQTDCQPAAAGASANGGVPGICQTYDSGYSSAVDIGSMKFVCFGNGISSVARETAIPTQTTTEASSGGSGHSECCCFCTVM
jgi:hypothetical protein